MAREAAIIKKLSLLAKYSILSLIITAGVSLFVAWGLQRNQEARIIDIEADSAADQVETVLASNLLASDFTEPLSAERYQQIDDLIRRDIVHEHVVRVKLWNPDGKLIYSDAGGGEMVGETPEMSHELKEALDGDMATEISNLEKEENTTEAERFEHLLEVYAPVRLDGSDQIVGAFEAYHHLGVLEPGIADMRRFVALSMGAGAVIIYFSLFGIVSGASRQLVRRSRENRHLFEEEKTRRSELSALYGLSRSLVNAPPEEGESLDIIVRHAVDTLHVTFACAFLLEGDSVVQRTAHPIRYLGRDLKVEQCYLNDYCPRLLRAALADEPIMIHRDEITDLSGHESQMLYLDLAQTICLVPIKAGEIPLGVLLMGESRSDSREPFTPEKLRLCSSIADQAASALQRANLFSDLEKAYLETVLTLANAVEAKDTYTKNHAENVSHMAVEVGKAMGLDDSLLEDLKYGGVLHDVGKIGVPDAVLKKPGKLDDDEWILMRAHAALGFEIIKPVHRLAGAAKVVRHHHERYDGHGYPDGIAGEAIPITARILTTVDSYSAIVDRRPYKQARSHAEAIAELNRCAGTQFDPQVVENFIGLFESGTLIPEE
ncbi:MAG: HD domain-containing phosphohydrolase [Thermoleophilia bacterium]